MTTETAAAAETARKGRVRSPEEIERAKKSAEFTRKVKGDVSVVKDAALKALKTSEGKGPAMAAALLEAIEQSHGVKFAKPAIRTMLLRLKKAGILKVRKVGTAYEWEEGNGKAEATVSTGRKPGRPSKASKAAEAAAKPSKGASAARAGGAGGGNKKAGKLAQKLVKNLEAALSAAQGLQSALESTPSISPEMLRLLKAIKG